MNERYKSILNILPENFKNALTHLLEKSPEEIRIRINAPVYVYSENKEFYLYSHSEMLCAKREDIDYILQKATENSLYAYTENIKNGFITIKNGHRIGVCGKAVYENKKLINIKEISGLNIRCSNEIKGVGEKIFGEIFCDGNLKNTLIVSPPKCGKTTILRDLTRMLSNRRGIKVALIDERDEIASVYLGVNSNDVGERTFVLSGYHKKDGFSHAVRAMAPTVIICDEIGDEEDFKIIKDALIRGVKVIATLHGEDKTDLSYECISSFERVVFLSRYFESKIYRIDEGELIEC